MRAWIVNDTDGTDGLEQVEIDEPQSGVIIEMSAAGIGYPDLLMRRGQFQIPQTPPFVLGWEAAGVVVETPVDSHFQVGDRVATMSFGAFAQRIRADADTTFVIPDSMSLSDAASVPLNYYTALAAMRRGGVSAGDVVAIHGAAGGVGTAAIQMARARGATSIAIVSTEEKARFATACGADHAVLVGDWRNEIKSYAPRGVDVIIDPVGGDRFTDSLRALAPEGRVVVVGFVGGAVPSVPVNRLLFNNTDVRGCTWSILGDQPGGFRAASAEITALIDSGEITAAVTGTIAFSDLESALRTLDGRRALGKQVLLAP